VITGRLTRSVHSVCVWDLEQYVEDNRQMSPIFEFRGHSDGISDVKAHEGRLLITSSARKLLLTTVSVQAGYSSPVAGTRPCACGMPPGSMTRLPRCHLVLFPWFYFCGGGGGAFSVLRGIYGVLFFFKDRHVINVLVKYLVYCKSNILFIASQRSAEARRLKVSLGIVCL
jgi:hypothetical protein